MLFSKTCVTSAVLVIGLILQSGVNAVVPGTETVTIINGDWGSWRGMKGYNRGGFYVCGASMRLEGKQGTTTDDTAANGLRVKYCHFDDWNTQSGSISIIEGDWGSWSSWKYCPEDSYMMGALIRYESPGGDDTALNGMKMICRHKNTGVSDYVAITNGHWGSWRTAVVRNTKYVTKMEARYESPGGDDTALNGLKMQVETPNSGMSAEEVSGFWKDVASAGGGTLERSVITSMTTTATESLTTTQQTTVSATVGAEFKFFSASVTAEHSRTVSQSVSNTIALTSATTTTVACPPYSDSPTILWQWTMTQPEDDFGPGFYMKTDHFICAPDISPRCPLKFCLGASCQVCKPPFEALSAITPGPTRAPVTAAPNLRPTQAPVAAPVNPAPVPAPAPADDDAGFCFSRSNSVQVLGKATPIPMASLQIGDYVKVHDNGGEVQSFGNSYSRVFSFGHHHEDLEVVFLQIHLNGLKAPLEITDAHLLFTANLDHDAHQQQHSIIRAQNVKVGDKLLINGSISADKVNSGNTKENGQLDFAVVDRIETVRRRGVYAPITDTGSIVVSGVVASSYVAFFDEAIFSAGLQHSASHAILAPHRMMCGSGVFEYWFGTCQERETYTEHGISNFIAPILDGVIYKLARYQNQNQQQWYGYASVVVPWLALVAAAPILVLASTLEQFISYYNWILMLIGVYFYVYCSETGRGAKKSA